MPKMNYLNNIKENFKGIIDCTLREGEQFAGKFISEVKDYEPFEFSVSQAKTILENLYLLGIEMAEVPNPVSSEVLRYTKQLVKSSKRPRLLAHIRNKDMDIGAAIEAGVDGVNILTTVDPKRISGMHLTQSQYLQVLKETILTAHEYGIETRVSVEHSWNSDLNTSLKVYKLAKELNVNRIGLADTKGIATHWDVANFITIIRKEIRDIDIEVHFHNDCFGSVTNALEALNCGANYVDTTICGIGERTGITPMSAFLYRLYTLNPRLAEKYEMPALKSIEEYVSKLTKVELPFNLITSDTAFSHKAGIHLNAILNIGPQQYENTDPEVVGNKRVLITGSRISGKTTKEQAESFNVTFERKFLSNGGTL